MKDRLENAGLGANTSPATAPADAKFLRHDLSEHERLMDAASWIAAVLNGAGDAQARHMAVYALGVMVGAHLRCRDTSTSSLSMHSSTVKHT